MAEKKKKTEEKNREAFNKAAKNDKPIAGGNLAPMADRDLVRFPGVKRFIITSAQNNTYVNEGFLKAMETCAKETDATIIASTFTYNKNAYLSRSRNAQKEGAKEAADDDKKMWYDPRLEPYFHRDENGNPRSNRPIELAPGLILGGELNIKPTAGDPLSGLFSYFRGNNSGIVPHAKQRLLSLPGPKSEGAHFQYTTGAVTQRNYVEQKEGQKADKNHVYGALIVEVDDNGDWFVRQIQADKTGGFYDLDPKTGKIVKYMPNGDVIRGKRAMSVSWGDVHVAKLSDDVREAAWGKGGILDTLHPYSQFLHDVLDMFERGHHSIKSQFHLAARQALGKGEVEQEIADVAKFYQDAERPDVETRSVASNHHDHFVKWLEDVDNIKKDPLNMAYFHECLGKIHREIKNGNTDFADRVYEWAVRQKAELKNTQFLGVDDSSVVGENADGYGIDNIHGHVSYNGLKGSANTLRRAARRVTSGHTHTAGIIDGVYTNGVMGDLDMGYNKGGSTWSRSFTITYPNTARTIITMNRNNHKWRAMNAANDNKPKAKPQPKKVKKLKPK